MQSFEPFFLRVQFLLKHCRGSPMQEGGSPPPLPPPLQSPFFSLPTNPSARSAKPSARSEGPVRDGWDKYFGPLFFSLFVIGII